MPKSPTASQALGPAANDSSRIAGVELLKSARANEFFLAIVAPAGAGAGTAASVLESYLSTSTIDGQPVETVRIKASQAIRNWADAAGHALPPQVPQQRKSLDEMISMQDLGDRMRSESGDNAAVARAMMGMIRSERARLSKKPEGKIDGKPRAFIIDSVRHPDEVLLLRRVYQDAFALVGVVADPESRTRRLRDHFDKKEWQSTTTKKKIEEFVVRDADAPVPHGQHVTAAFHEADLFVNNSDDAQDLKQTSMNDPIRRFVDLLTGTRVIRLTISETAMHHAHSAKLRSACMSRQVGAAVVDRQGNIVSTGTNEVPRAGGGLYGEAHGEDITVDHRCVFRETRFCSSNREQNAIIDELLSTFPELTQGKDVADVRRRIRKTRLGGLIEFSRAVHAEMDALLSAARVGVSLVGTRLYVSTFPCHYCARHIVSAGVDEVQYIEPYPKSRALVLHDDAITTSSAKWEPPSQNTQLNSKVLFRPFVGVSPRMYERAFLKDRSYKDDITGDHKIGAPLWGASTSMSMVHYTQLEEQLGLVST